MNYAIPGRQAGRFQGDYTRDLAGLTGAARETFAYNPDVAYENWLQWLKPTLSREQALRRLFSVFQTRFDAEVASKGAEGSQMKWDEWLGTRDVDRELNRFGPSSRSEQPNRFGGASRYVSF